MDVLDRIERKIEIDAPASRVWKPISEPGAADGPSTPVAFRIVETSPVNVVLTVVETGFASLPEGEKERRSRYDSRVEGWGIEMGLAKRHVEVAVDAR